MAFDLGDVVPLAVEITDSNGVPANAGAVVLTLTLPDGTTTSPTLSNTSAGNYQVDYLTIQAGRHIARWVATGLNASAYVEMFDVRPADMPLLISLTDTKEQLNKIATVDDEELRRLVEAATAAVERHLDKVVVRRTIVERRDLGNPQKTNSPGVLQSFALSSKPVLSLTSVVSADGEQTWATADMEVTTSGVVRVLSGVMVWGLVDFTYVAGMAVIPAHYSVATGIIVQHIWQNTQRGQKGSPRAGLETPGAGFTSFGYALPNAALELLGPNVGGIA